MKSGFLHATKPLPADGIVIFIFPYYHAFLWIRKVTYLFSFSSCFKIFFTILELNFLTTFNSSLTSTTNFITTPLRTIRISWTVFLQVDKLTRSMPMLTNASNIVFFNTIFICNPIFWFFFYYIWSFDLVLYVVLRRDVCWWWGTASVIGSIIGGSGVDVIVDVFGCCFICICVFSIFCIFTS